MIDKLLHEDFVIHIGYGDKEIITIIIHPIDTMLMAITAGVGFIFGGELKFYY